jgi:hypothetical protein
MAYQCGIVHHLQSFPDPASFRVSAATIGISPLVLCISAVHAEEGSNKSAV